MPKFLETAFRLLRKRGLARNVPGWELLVFGLAMGILNIFYQHEVKLIMSKLSKNKIGKCYKINISIDIQKILGIGLIN